VSVQSSGGRIFRRGQLREAPLHHDGLDLANPLNAKVSVVVPCYNYGRFLRDCVESVLEQANVNLDVLIVDDASTDNSWNVAQDLANSDTRVSIRRSPVNRGMIATINDAMWQVEGDYIVKLDADDLLTPGSLGRSMALLEAHPEVAFAYGAPIYFEDWEMPAYRTTVTGWTVWRGDQWLARRCTTAKNCIGQPEVVIRQASLRAAGRYTESLGHTSDFEMWLRLSMLGSIGWIHGADQGLMRVHAGSMQQTVHSGRITDIIGRRDAFEAFFSTRGADMPNRDSLHLSAKKALAEEALGLACSAYRHSATASEPVDAYVSFARDVYPDTENLASWKEQRRRMRLGASLAALDPTLVVRAAIRRYRGSSAKRRRMEFGL
jgi:hypothetical protein